MDNAADLAHRCDKPRQLANGSWTACCPAHNDQSPSLSISDGNKGTLVRCHAGCTPEAIMAALGRSMGDLFPPPPHARLTVRRGPQAAPPPAPIPPRLVATYDYHDAHGSVLYHVQRWEPGRHGGAKDFGQRRPDGQGGWINNMQGVTRVLWRLPQVLAAVQAGEVVYVTEGEKACTALLTLGVCGTTKSGGSGSAWEPQYSEALRGARVVILPDNDPPGRTCAQKTAQALHGIAACVQVLELPGLPEHGDVVEWLAAGGDRAQLEVLVQAAPLWDGVMPTLDATPTLISLNSFNSLPAWPQCAMEAFHGLPGEIVRTITPQTESDPVAILGQLLVMVGNAIGRMPYFPVEADRHSANMFLCLVGATSKGRKGTSAAYPRRLLGEIDPAWKQRVKGGLSSGEGVIWNVRDAVHGHNKKGEDVCEDEGEPDKRLCILESEFARALAKTGQEGNVLSAVLRQAWDTGDLNTLVSGRSRSPVQATGAHISVIAHITADELRRTLTEVEAANGFGNRFLWLCVQRSQLLPEGGDYPDRALAPLVAALRQAILAARQCARMVRSDTARQRWCEIYTAVAEGAPGLVGALTARAEAQVLRLSMLYALCDQSAVIDVPHLEAAYALWRYCEASARYIFGESLGDPLADTILQILRNVGHEGITRTDISHELGRNVKSAAIGQALALLSRERFAHSNVEKTSGRPSERWFFSPSVHHPHELNEKNEIRVNTENVTSSIIDLNSFNSSNSYTPAQAFASLTASELFCATCQASLPFRTLTVLDGSEVYVCEACDTEVGRKTATSSVPRTPQPGDPCEPEEFEF